MRLKLFIFATTMAVLFGPVLCCCSFAMVDAAHSSTVRKSSSACCCDPARDRGNVPCEKSAPASKHQCPCKLKLSAANVERVKSAGKQTNVATSAPVTVLALTAGLNLPDGSQTLSHCSQRAGVPAGRALLRALQIMRC